MMGEIGVPMAPQATAKSFLEGKEAAQQFGIPLCIRSSLRSVERGLRLCMILRNLTGS